MRLQLKTVSLNLIVLFVFLVLLEIIFRTVTYFVLGPELLHSQIVSDDTFGWVHNTKASTYVGTNRCNEEVTQKPSSHRLINKFPAHSNGQRILFIGDSYTHATAVSTGKAYYDVFEEQKGESFSVYAAGIGGYGNLQESRVLDAVYDQVKPEIVIWQMCANDIHNNVYELDSASFYNNQRPRPYLIDGQIQFRNPGLWLFDWSKGFQYVFKKLLIVDRKYDLGFLDWANSTLALEPEAKEIYLSQGFGVLDFVLHEATEKYPDITFIGFSVNDKFDSEFKQIFEKNGASYIAGFDRYVSTMGNTDCEPLDGHWNLLGNEVAGEKLSELLDSMHTQ